MSGPLEARTPGGSHATSPDSARCVLCGGRPVAVVGIFEPREPWRYWPSAPEPGKVRWILYGLCAGCMGPRAAEAVEAELLRRMAGEGRR